MFSISTPSIYQSSKCFITYGTMGHPDLTQLPAKEKPWSALLAQDFVHKVDVILPQEFLPLVRDKLVKDSTRWPTCLRVIMTLSDMLQGEFFNEYIKIGNIMMLSKGRTDSDDVFSLKDGQLTLYLEKETYERAGLVGKPHGIKGKRGLKPRWIVEYDLRSPSMLRGKNAFDRLLYACKNVLNAPTTWLFCNLSKTPIPDPLLKHASTRHTSRPSILEGPKAVIPALKPPTSVIGVENRLDLDEFGSDVYEWLSMVRLESPRIEATDQIDPYLSRYVVPGQSESNNEVNLCKISWEGFISTNWTRQTLAELIHALPSKSWFSLSSTSFSRSMADSGSDCTILRPPDGPGEYFLWEVKGHR
ncbi:ribonuclease P 40kDa subunit [Xylariomycetidae sp. FL2044]|nr:ribonuclease P 40kDa subunit [Xylariomycetidae sp. FL2044]